MNKYICFNKNDDYVYEIEKILCNKKKKILDFFETKDNGTFDFTIYVYDNLKEMYSTLKNKNISTNNLVYYLENNNSFYIYRSIDFNKSIYEQYIFNEEVKAIEHLIYGRHPRWLIEGISMYLNNDIEIDQIEDNELGYYVSYITVKYLIEYYTKPIFIRLICLQNFINYVEDNNLFDEAISYYRKKAKIKS